MPLRNQFESEVEWLDHMRMYFAAKALQGLLCNPEMRRDWGPQEWVEESYRYADAMLRAREAKS